MNLIVISSELGESDLENGKESRLMEEGVDELRLMEDHVSALGLANENSSDIGELDLSDSNADFDSEGDSTDTSGVD